MRKTNMLLEQLFTDAPMCITTYVDGVEDKESIKTFLRKMLRENKISPITFTVDGKSHTMGMSLHENLLDYSNSIEDAKLEEFFLLLASAETWVFGEIDTEGRLWKKLKSLDHPVIFLRMNNNEWEFYKGYECRFNPVVNEFEDNWFTIDASIEDRWCRLKSFCKEEQAEAHQSILEDIHNKVDSRLINAKLDFIELSLLQ